MSDQQSTVDVPSVVHQLKQQVAHLEKNVLAYGDLMRGTTPIVLWTTRSTDDRPLEIQTDLGAIDDSQGIREAMAKTHAEGIREGLIELQILINTIQGVMDPAELASAPAPKTAAPGTAVIDGKPVTLGQLAVDPGAAAALAPAVGALDAAPLPANLPESSIPPVQPTASILPPQPATAGQPEQPGQMAGPGAPNVLPVPPAPPIQPQVQPQPEADGVVLVPPGRPNGS